MPAKKGRRARKTIPELPEESDNPETGSQDKIPDTPQNDLVKAWSRELEKT